MKFNHQHLYRLYSSTYNGELFTALALQAVQQRMGTEEFMLHRVYQLCNDMSEPYWDIDGLMDELVYVGIDLEIEAI